MQLLTLHFVHIFQTVYLVLLPFRPIADLPSEYKSELLPALNEDIAKMDLDAGISVQADTKYVMELFLFKLICSLQTDVNQVS